MGAGPLTSAAIGLGTSLGEPFGILTLAVHALDHLPQTRVVRTSRVWWSGPAGGVARCAFHNAVVRVETDTDPDVLLARLKALEVRLGRRPSRGWADRRLDLDLLVFGRRIVVGRRIAIPHPRLVDRPFVLLPLAEAWPDARDPWSGRPYTTFPTAALAVRGTLPAAT
jgi:2-amino-4-hydroxy-6-hydroxymethyldihydropteridine diphosphokinase